MRKYGWLKDPHDPRDFIFRMSKPTVLPRKIDLRSMCSKVEDQGNLGSCTANALAGALEFLEIKDGVYYEDFSRLFIYYNEREMEGSVNEDAGAYIRDGIKTLVRHGACSEELWPYAPNNFAVKPPQACYEDALNHQVLEYRRITNINDIRLCLSEGYPVVIGFLIYPSFEGPEVAQTGIWNPTEFDVASDPLGGHAVTIVGYDDDKMVFIIRNSWGENWGDGGYFTMPYWFVRKHASDFWTIRRVEEH